MPFDVERISDETSWREQYEVSLHDWLFVFLSDSIWSSSTAFIALASRIIQEVLFLLGEMVWWGANQEGGNEIIPMDWLPYEATLS